MKKVSINLAEEDLNTLTKLADQRGISLNTLIREIIGLPPLTIPLNSIVTLIDSSELRNSALSYKGSRGVVVGKGQKLETYYIRVPNMVVILIHRNEFTVDSRGDEVKNPFSDFTQQERDLISSALSSYETWVSEEQKDLLNSLYQTLINNNNQN